MMRSEINPVGWMGRERMKDTSRYYMREGRRSTQNLSFQEGSSSSAYILSFPCMPLPNLRPTAAMYAQAICDQSLTVPFNSSIVTSLRLGFPNAAAAVSHCFRLVGYSLPVNSCRTLELVTKTTTSGLARGTNFTSIDL